VKADENHVTGTLIARLHNGGNQDLSARRIGHGDQRRIGHGINATDGFFWLQTSTLTCCHCHLL